MKKKKLHLFFKLFPIILVVFSSIDSCCWGCGNCNDNTTTPNPPVSAPTKHLFIGNLNPDRMPNSLDSSFIITFVCENINVDSIITNLKIKEYKNNNCTALDLNFRMCGNNNLSKTLTVPMLELNNCIENNAVYKIVLSSPDDPSIKGDSTYYVRGNPTIGQTSGIPVEKASMPQAMPPNDDDLKDSIIIGIDTTFGNDTTPNVYINWSDWISNENLLDIIFPSYNGTPDGLYKYINTELNNYAYNIRSNQSGYILILADSQAMKQGIFGFSNNSKYDNTYENWSFIFTRNISSNYSYDPNVFTRTLYTFNVAHELLRQLGNEFSPWPPNEKDPDPLYWEQNRHSGNNNLKCVLYEPLDFLANNPGIWERSTGYFKICDRHTFMLRNNLGGIPPMVFRDKNTDPLNNLAGGFNDSKYEVKISLPKFTYKEFELVEVEVKVINHDSSPLNFWGGLGGLDSYKGLTWATISDDYGNSWSQDNNHTDKIDAVLGEPHYIVQPGDTIFLTVGLNQWGKEARWISAKDNDQYFASGYFPANSSYSAYIILKLNCNPEIREEWKNCINVKSNKVRFEVTEINDTDKEILNLYQKITDEYYKILLKKDYSLDNILKTYKDIIDKFPNNPLIENIYIDYLGVKATNIMSVKNSKYTDEYENDFTNFINKYPNSLILLEDNNIKLYLSKHFINPDTNSLISNFDEEFENVKMQNKDNMLKYVLRDKERVKKIILPRNLHYKNYY